MTATVIYHPRLADACARFGGTPSDWLDLSTGINPDSWQPPEPLRVNWQALPDPAALGKLEHTAARYFECSPALCAAVPGSEIGLRQLARLLGLPGLYQPLAYGTYAAAFGRAEPINDLSRLPSSATALLLGNPNNPDGRVLSRETLLSLLNHQERHGGWLIVDEAFADCKADWGIAAEVAPGRRLIVIRSFGKFFGLAGLRLGFVIAPPEVLTGLSRSFGDWPIHTAALAYGQGAYADSTWITATRRSLECRAAALEPVLQRLGLSTLGACPLFRLAKTPNAGDLFG
ncbi:MAG: threonine-phosphate decarboxylase, partial [Sphingomonadales bacterium 39-62-4]